MPFKSATYLSLAWAGDVGLRRRVEAYNTARPHSLGYATPAAFAAELEKQRSGLNPTVSSPVLLRDNGLWRCWMKGGGHVEANMNERRSREIV